MANKKINQLVAKTTIQSTDLFPLGDASTGQLFKKTIAELQAAIGGAVISVNGLVGTVVLDTDDIQELATPTNKYFTDARARGAISLTVTGNSGASTYSNSTGVLNVPTYTLAGLGGITATFLSGASGIAYNSSTGVITYTGTVFTDASIRALVSAGAGLSYNSSTGVFSYSGTVYTDASIRALISLTTTGNSGVSSYNNTTGVLNVPNYTLAGLGGISSTFLTAGTGISYSSSTGVISYSGTVYTDSSVRGLFSATAPITYNSSTGAIGITQASTSANGFLSSTDWNTFNGKQNALTLGNVTEVASNVLMFPDGGTNKTIGNLSIQVVQAGASTNGFLSSTDWTTFNNKQATITLTTTGTSGAATFSAGTLNIPQYQAALTNPVTGTGTTNYHAKWTSSTALGNSLIFDDGTNVGIGTASPSNILSISSSVTNTSLSPESQVTITNTNSGNHSTLGFRTTDSDGTHGRGGITVTKDSGSVSGALNLLVRQNISTSIIAIRINSNGNVGIGTSTPGEQLTLSRSSYPTVKLIDTTDNAQGYFQYHTDNNYFILNAQSNHPLLFGTNDTERMRINAAGTSFFSNDIFCYVNGGIFFAGNGNYNSGIFQVAGTGGGLGIQTSTLLRIFVTAGGNILMGTQSDNGERLYVSGSIRATGSITANSDVRLKKNIERIENALQKVSEISGYTYNTIYDEDRHAGVIAQEIDKVLPEIVNKGNDGLMGVEYGNISALLIEAIKDLKKDNESLRAIVEGLTK
jgi:hypothetical protein